MLGFRFHGSVLDAVASVVVLVALAASMSALFGRIGDRVRRPDVVQFAGMMIMMPFMFVSGAFAPLATMPGWMRTMAALNPVSPRHRRPTRPTCSAPPPWPTPPWRSPRPRSLWALVTLVPSERRR